MIMISFMINIQCLKVYVACQLVCTTPILTIFMFYLLYCVMKFLLSLDKGNFIVFKIRI